MQILRKHFPMFLLALVAVTWPLSAFSRAGAPPAQAPQSVRDFAGTWNWMFQDRKFATMNLQWKDGAVFGSLTNGAIEMDDRGKITSAAAAPGSSPITGAQLKDGLLRIDVKIDGQTEQLNMKLTSDTTAEIRFADEGAPQNTEPIRLEKVWSEPPVDR